MGTLVWLSRKEGTLGLTEIRKLLGLSLKWESFETEIVVLDEHLEAYGGE